MQPIPTINVNLTTCKCAGAPDDADPLRDASGHIREFNGRPYCAAAPVLIPCHIPRSVTFKVRLGDGTCLGCPTCTIFKTNMDPTVRGIHAGNCPARPIRVTFNISGKTWAESEVGDVDADFNHPINTARQMEIASERWALVKALVLGKFAYRDVGDAGPGTPEGLFKQRDAVYAALAKVAQTEAAAHAAHFEMFKALEAADVAFSSSWPVRGTAELALAAYVERLVEQVGVLGVSP